MVAILSETIWNPNENVWILNGPVLNGWDCSYSHSPTIWKLDCLKSDLQKVWISNVSGFQMVGFQIPIVCFRRRERNNNKFFLKKVKISKTHNFWTSGPIWKIFTILWSWDHRDQPSIIKIVKFQNFDSDQYDSLNFLGKKQWKHWKNCCAPETS